ncbi:hypothetical protein GCM10027443_40790 [Pontibacter brevis]
MILYDNGFLKLDYNPSTDILYVQCPDVHEYDLLQIQQAFNIIIETVINYDIKKCILDTSKTKMNVGDENHSSVMQHLGRGLVTTRLQMLARIATKDTARERRVENYVRTVYAEVKPTGMFQNFTSKAAAVRWLTGGNVI